MTLVARKRLVVCLLIGVVSLANAALVVQWLQRVGLVDLARRIRREYVTGTALAVSPNSLDQHTQTESFGHNTAPFQFDSTILPENS